MEGKNNETNIAVLNLGTNFKKDAVVIFETAMYLIEQYAGPIINSSYIYETVPEYIVNDEESNFCYENSENNYREKAEEEKAEEEKEEETEEENVINSEEHVDEVPFTFDDLKESLKPVCSRKKDDRSIIYRCNEYDSFLRNETKEEDKIDKNNYIIYETETKKMIKENDKMMKLNLQKYKNRYYTLLFYNLSIVIQTSIKDLLTLLVVLKCIEQMLGRKKMHNKMKFENRRIDIDILFFNNSTIFEKTVKLEKEVVDKILFDYMSLNKEDKKILEIRDNLNEEIQFLCIPHLYISHRFSILLCLNDMMPQYRHPYLKHSIHELFTNFIDKRKKLDNVNLLKVNKKMYVLKDQVFYLKGKTNIVGILNVNFDSFSDGALFVCPEVAVNRMFEMISQGAIVIDIGGESSAPHVVKTTTISERDLVMPVLEKFHMEWDKRNNEQRDIIDGKTKKPEKEKPVISIDTTNYDLFKECIEKNLVDVLNDISACTDNPDIVKLLKMKKYRSVILMHKRGNPHTMDLLTDYENDDVSGEVKKYLLNRLQFLVLNGIPRYRIILDVGLGFAKKAHQSVQLLKDIHFYDSYPFFLGYSRKRFVAYCVSEETYASSKAGSNKKTDIKESMEEEKDKTVAQNKWIFKVQNYRKDRDSLLYQKMISGGLGIASYAFFHKVDFIRVHDVLETKAVLNVLKKLHE